MTSGDLTGHGPGFLTWWARLLWMKEEAPQLFERIRSACGIADWLAYRLTGELTIDSALAVDSGVGALTTGRPAEAIAEKLGIDVSIFPPVSRSGCVVGTMSKVASDRLGLPKGIPVVKAGPDTQTALVGMGVSEPGHAGIATGWSTPVQCVTNQQTLDSTRTLWTGRHVVHDRWVVEGNSGVMGGAYDWLISMLGGTQDLTESMARLDAEASQVERGARGVAAHLGPSLVQFEDVGLRPGGLLFPVPLAFEPPDAATIVRASLESFAFAIRLILNRTRELTGPVDDSVSRWWLDSILNIPRMCSLTSSNRRSTFPKVPMFRSLERSPSRPQPLSMARGLNPDCSPGAAKCGSCNLLRPRWKSTNICSTRGCRGSNNCWNSNSRINVERPGEPN